MSETQPANNVTFECLYQDGIIRLEPRLDGHLLSATVTDAHIVLSLRISGDLAEGNVARVNIISLSLKLDGEPIQETHRRNWVGWSKIGEASFVLDVTNDAGFRPMNWSGEVYAIKQLGKGAVVYGSDGITLMSPAQQTFAFRDLAFIGLLVRDAVCGDDTTHYFIDKKYQLWKLSEQGAVYLELLRAP